MLNLLTNSYAFCWTNEGTTNVFRGVVEHTHQNTDGWFTAGWGFALVVFGFALTLRLVKNIGRNSPDL